MPHSPDRAVPEPAARALRIAVVGDRVDWHARELAKALAELGARAAPVRLEDFQFTTDAR